MAISPILTCHGRQVDNQFGLLSRNENGLTFALGYVLSKCPNFLRHFLRRLDIGAASHRTIRSIHLQRHSDSDESFGITDIDIVGEDFYLVIEAKKHGWPTIKQLRGYADELAATKRQRKLYLCALGVSPVCDSEARNWAARNNVNVIHLRWHDIVAIIRALCRQPDNQESVTLSVLADFIEEVIAMPSYDVEVLVRDIKFPHESSSLYYDHLLYNSGAKRIAEPLFFAPNITKPAPLAMDGIQFISRVYHIDRFNVHNRQEAHSALERARKLINERIAVLKRRKTTKDSITYLSDLPSKWARGIRRMPHVWPSDKKNVAILFLGEPMRLPMAVKKKGGQIPPGFNLTLESLLIGGSRSFMC